ncbi:phosphopentomutase [Effusibacillus lacus]|uniref:Phosphopentomutase n=1 Tax=Effusibacillus lacus TaxID=1348429 RepID=A0A292YTU5_9BACL|nr:phosphopentomutase [Effusibacillus lacus]TCS76319.1 phosphopentomutase [Effusibacillus lacus]GAX91864.1 phosphopentomutase [Effusibacillus lacus]
MNGYNRVILIVLDSCGIGEMTDAADYGDVGANTIGNIARAVGSLNVPNMAKLGLGRIHPIQGVPTAPVAGAYGKMAEQSAGKDTTNGHWEMVGVKLEHPLPTYPEGFPREIMDEFEQRIGRKTLGNKPASGTEILKELGDEHMRTGFPIVYTSADSVFQIAAHEEVIPLDELYRYCGIARELLVGPHGVGRVIARPFVGSNGQFTRTANRRDYSLLFGRTVLNELQDAGLEVIGIGKIEDIYGGSGITGGVHTEDNMDGVDKTLDYMKNVDRGLIFANLVDFDAKYGHRNDPAGFARAIEQFDGRLPEIVAAMREDDLLILTADHGCDPTTEGTDHTREFVPVLLYGKHMQSAIDIGTRDTFADLGATIAENFGVPNPGIGTSFYQMIKRQEA